MTICDRMSICEIINRMNAGEAITTPEYNYWMENYDPEMHPWIDPLSRYQIIDINDVELDDEMTEELAYDAAVFGAAMEAIDRYVPTDDGSWYGR